MEHLRRHDVEITHEHAWDSGRRSFYFQDPAGNLLEIADGELWPR
jgi:catechol 2,3-dioxygenase-like lactoylglutathione lyase family enzyme